MASVLVLGGAGFIGYHLVRQLAVHGCDQITLVDNLSRGRLDSDLEQLLTDNKQIKLLTGDLTRSDTFDQIVHPRRFYLQLKEKSIDLRLG